MLSCIIEQDAQQKSFLAKREGLAVVAGLGVITLLMGAIIVKKIILTKSSAAAAKAVQINVAEKGIENLAME